MSAFKTLKTGSMFNELTAGTKILAVLGEAFPKLSGAITAAGAAATAAGGGFAGLAAGAGALLRAINPLILVGAGIVAAVGIFDLLTTSAAEANEKMNNSFSAYEQARSEVENVNNELATTQSRIDELNAKKSLTFVEQSELNKLQEANEKLQLQADLKDKEEKRAAKQVAEDTVDSYRKNFTEGKVSDETVSNYEYAGNPIGLANGESISEKLAGIKKYKELRQEALSSGDKESYIDYNDIIDSTTESIWEQVTTLEDYKSKLETVADTGGKLSKEEQNALNDISDTIEYVYKKLDPEKWKQLQYDKIFNQDRFSGFKDELISIAEKTDNIGISAEKVEKKYPRLVSAMKEAGITSQDIANNINSDAGIKNIEEMKKQLSDGFIPNMPAIGLNSQRYIDIARNQWENFIKDMSDEDFEILYSIKQSNDTSGWNIEDWTVAFENAKSAAEELNDDEIPTISSLFENDSEGSLTKQVDQFQSNVSSIDDALSKLRDGEKVDLTDLTQQFPTLIGQTDNLEESLSKLKVDEYKGILSNIFTSMDANGITSPEEIAKIVPFIQGLFDGANLSDLELGNIKNGIVSQLMSKANGAVERQMTTDWINNLFDGIQPQFSSLKDILGDSRTASTLDKYKSKISSLRTSLYSLKSGDKNAIVDLLDQFPELASETGNLQNNIEDLIDSLNQDAGTFFDDIIEKMKLDGVDQSAIEAAEKYKEAFLASLSDIDESILASPLMDAIDKAWSSDNAGKDYENAASKLKSAKELYDNGLVGTDDFKSYAKYISPTGATDPSNFIENYKKATRYLTEDSSGVRNFLNDLSKQTDSAGKALASFNEQTGEWTVGISDADSAAQSMGMGFEFFMDMFGRLEDYGARNNMFATAKEGKQHIADLTSELVNAQKELAQLETQGANSSAIEAKKAEIQSIVSDIESSNTSLNEIMTSSTEKEISNMQDAIKMINEMATARDDAIKNKETFATDEYVNEVNRQIQQIAKDAGIELTADFTVSDESKQKLESQLKEIYGKGTIENPFDRVFGSGRTAAEAAQMYGSVTQKIQEQAAKGNEQLVSSFEELKKYSESQLSGIKLSDGTYDSEELKGAEMALDSIISTLGLSKEEASQLVNVLADMGRIKLDADTTSLDDAVEKTEWLDNQEVTEKVTVEGEEDLEQLGETMSNLSSEESIATVAVDIQNSDQLNGAVEQVKNVPENTDAQFTFRVNNQEDADKLTEELDLINENRGEHPIQYTIEVDDSELTSGILSEEELDKTISVHVEEEGIDKLLSLEDEELSNTLEIDSSQVDEARQKLVDLKNSENSLTVKIDESQFTALTSKTQEVTAKVTPENDTIDVKVNDATVKVTPENEPLDVKVAPAKVIVNPAKTRIAVGTEPTTVDVTPNPSEVEVSVKDATVDVKPNKNPIIVGVKAAPVDVGNTVGSKNIKANVSVDSSQVDSYQPGDKNATVHFEKDSKEPDSYKPADKYAEVNYSLGSTPNYNPSNLERTLTYKIVTKGSVPAGAKPAYTGTMLSPAHASGTAYNVLNTTPISNAHASGQIALQNDERALVNELGIIICRYKIYLIAGNPLESYKLQRRYEIQSSVNV